MPLPNFWAFRRVLDCQNGHVESHCIVEWCGMRIYDHHGVWTRKCCAQPIVYGRFLVKIARDAPLRFCEQIHDKPMQTTTFLAQGLLAIGKTEDGNSAIPWVIASKSECTDFRF